MTPRDRAEQLMVNQFGMNIDHSDEFENDIRAIEDAITDAVGDEQCAMAYQLGEMTAESRSSTEREIYIKVAGMIADRVRRDKPDKEKND